MTPQKSSQEEPSPENAPGYNDFVRSLTDFAADRGYTSLFDFHSHAKPLIFGRGRILVDFQTRVAGKHIDLFKLYNIVTSRGGYDAVSIEKLGWRRVGGDFNLGHVNAAAYAFALKTTYYKNLALVYTQFATEPL